MGGEHYFNFHSQSACDTWYCQNKTTPSIVFSSHDFLKYKCLAKIICQFYKTCVAYKPAMFLNLNFQVQPMLDTNDAYLTIGDYWILSKNPQKSKFNWYWSRQSKDLHDFYHDVLSLFILTFPGYICAYNDRCYSYDGYTESLANFHGKFPTFHLYRVPNIDPKGYRTTAVSAGMDINKEFKKALLLDCVSVKFDMVNISNKRLLSREMLLIFKYLCDRLCINVVNIIGDYVYVCFKTND